MSKLVSEVLNEYLARLEGPEAARAQPPAAPQPAERTRGRGRVTA
jgi:hypothetical protein